jgi:hypothetical protein
MSGFRSEFPALPTFSGFFSVPPAKRVVNSSLRSLRFLFLCDLRVKIFSSPRRD